MRMEFVTLSERDGVWGTDKMEFEEVGDPSESEKTKKITQRA